MDSGKQNCEPLITTEEAAKLLGGLHPKTIERMARRHELPAMKLGKFWMYRASQLDEWIAERLDSSRSSCRLKGQGL